jgi:ABC-2 type transport system permease protein
MKTTLLFAKTQLKRVFRDPVTLIVLFAIPMMLLILFGAFTRGTDNISLRVAVINNSSEQFSKTFSEQLKKVDVFKQPDKTMTVSEAKQAMRNDEIDGIVELPVNFGKPQNGAPTGKAIVYFDQTDMTTGDIVASVMNSVVDETNKQVTGVVLPLSVEKQSIAGSGARIFDGLFAMFTGMAIMMVGVFGVASVIPSDKKTGILRRLRVTPLKSSQLMIGTMLAYAVVSIVAVALMTLLAVFAFGLQVKGDWVSFGVFTLLATVLMLGFGLAIGGWAKNSTQADIYGQIVFIISLAFSGLWFPRSLMPVWLQDITAYLPLTPIVSGIQSIVTEGASLLQVGPEILIIVVWSIVVFAVGIKTFQWE